MTRGDLHPEHLADLRKSGITAATIAQQKLRTIPPDMIDPLAGFPVKHARSAYLIPFPHPEGGFMDHVKMRIFGRRP